MAFVKFSNLEREMDKINKNYKIGLMSDTFLPQIGGAEIHIKNIAHFLKNDGYDVEVFTNTQGEKILNGIKIYRNNNKGNKIWRLLKDTKNIFLFVKNVDVVHAHYTFYLACLSGVVAKILRKPFVVTLHGLGTLDSSVNKNFRRKIYRYVSFKMADAVVATSGEMADVAKRFTDQKAIFIVSNGVDTEYFKSKDGHNEQGKIIVLSARRLNPKNGVQYLVEAIPMIAEKFPEIEFWIAGKDKLENYLKERVKDLKMENFVKFIGEIQNDDMLRYYNDADIVVFPSSAESTSIACLEAMSCEKAIVASALSAFKEMLDDDKGVLVKLFDREDSNYDAPLTLPQERIDLLADAILKLANDKDRRVYLGKKARDFVVINYDWKILTKKVELIYRQIHEKKEK